MTQGDEPADHDFETILGFRVRILPQKVRNTNAINRNKNFFRIIFMGKLI